MRSVIKERTESIRSEFVRPCFGLFLASRCSHAARAARRLARGAGARAGAAPVNPDHDRQLLRRAFGGRPDIQIKTILADSRRTAHEHRPDSVLHGTGAEGIVLSAHMQDTIWAVS